MVDDGGAWVLVDAGRGATQRALDAGLDLGRLQVVCLTHHHSDHLSDLATLAITRWVSGAIDPLPVVAPSGAEQSLRRALPRRVRGRQLPRAVRSVAAVHDQRSPSMRSSRRRRPPRCGRPTGWSISSALVDHHPVAPAVGYRVDVMDASVAVSGDTAVCPGIEWLARGADVLVHETVLEARASAELLAWNAGAVSVGRLAVVAEVGTLVLTHLLPAPRTQAHEQAYLDEVRSGGWAGPVLVAHDLLRVPLSG